MRLKLKKSILSLTLLLIGFTLFSCVSEPYIEPVKGTFSEIKVVNLSSNVTNMKVLIDDKQPVASLNNLASPSATEYFDINSGKRTFKILNASDEVIFTKIIEIISWERMIIIFSGFYSTDELLNTFSNFEVFEGEVYVSSNPASGTSNAYFIHGSAAEDTLDSREYNVGAVSSDNVVTSFGTIGFEDVLGVDSVMAGNFNFYFKSEVAGDSTAINQNINSDLRYYFFLYGRPDNLMVFFNEVIPPPARSRD